jgi:uncharacterized protein (TIGR03435 family)
MISGFILNHLWQSTVFGAAMALFALIFRKNSARVRFAFWLAASIKFLVPFALLITIGNSIYFGVRQPDFQAQPAAAFVQNVSQPFSSMEPLAVVPVVQNQNHSRLLWTLAFSIWLGGCLVVMIFYLTRGKRVGKIVRDSVPLNHGREFEALERMRQNRGRRRPIKLAASHSLMEPGVLGIFHPILLLPSEISERLCDSELEAIIAHELAHARRRDNLLSAIHMFIEALFWFHPMIWWIGAKLVQEREKACDEEVLRLGKDPQAYAEGILKVCEFCLESPLACVAGITGADMKKRIYAIMSRHVGGELSFTKKLLLTAAGLAAIFIPLAVGFLNVPQVHSQSSGEINAAVPETSRPKQLLIGTQTANAQSPSEEAPAKTDTENSKLSFDAASIKPSLMKNGMSARSDPGRIFVDGVNLKYLIANAYGIEDYQISGGPAWIDGDRYTVEGKAASPNTPDDQMHRMLQTLLEERFKLKFHREEREIPTYSLIIAKDGPKLKDAGQMIGGVTGGVTGRVGFKEGKIFVTNSDGKTQILPAPAPEKGMAQLSFIGWTTMKEFARSLSRILAPRKVLDKTGLNGRYEIALKYGTGGGQTNLSAASGSQSLAEPSGPSIFTAIQEQLGLKLEPGKGTEEYFIIDSAEIPSEN